MRHRNAGGEAGRSAGILKVANVIRIGRFQRAFRRIVPGEALPVHASATLPTGSGRAEFRNFFRIEQNFRVRTVELDRKLIDISILAPEAGRQWQRDGPCPGIDRPAKQGGKLRAGFRDQSDAVARFDPGSAQPVSGVDCIAAQFGEAVSAFQIGAHIMKIKPLGAFCRIIQCIGKRCEVRSTSG